MSAAYRVASCLVACVVLGDVAELCAQTPPPPAKAKDGFAGKKAGEEWDDNGLKMKFCWCPAGKFTMGSPKEEKDRANNEDQVSVTISRGFWLGKYELTQGGWGKIMGTTLRQQRDKAGPADKLWGEGASYPMYFVNHNDSTEFCRKLTDQERRAGRLPAEWEYRLPTEAQWEYACRARDQARFSFGDNEADLDTYGWSRTATAPRTRWVASVPTRGGCTICMATCGNGAATGT